MDRELSGFPPFSDFSNGQGMDYSEIYKDPMFNPMVQYEQAFVYYKYLCMQMDYKIKCKEYEKMCNSSANTKNSEK
ncbi:MAG: hypothetical protein IKF38_03545 [Clostridia bacterium]|nr:hypothetical protein [Clostridia bacterium]